MGVNILAGATATGPGPWHKSGAFHHGLIIQFTDTLAALTVTLEGRIAGGAATTLGTHAFVAGEITAKTAYLFVSNSPVDDIRVNITVLTKNGGAPAISVSYKSNLN